jgi:hypothetical protein
MAKTFKGRVGWEVAKRLLKAIPYIGTVFSLGLAGHEIKKKGLVPGVVHVGLDVTPVVGTAKNVIEIVTGDWIPDKPAKPVAQTKPPQESAI